MNRMAQPDIETVWSRIEVHAGEEFRQIRGGAFRYQVCRCRSCLVPDRVNFNLPRSDFEKALELVPFGNTVPLQHLRGPSYLYAILMDPRIRQVDW